MPQLIRRLLEKRNAKTSLRIKRGNAKTQSCLRQRVYGVQRILLRWRAKCFRGGMRTIGRCAQFPNTVRIRWIPLRRSSQLDFTTKSIRLRKCIFNDKAANLPLFEGSQGVGLPLRGTRTHALTYPHCHLLDREPSSPWPPNEPLHFCGRPPSSARAPSFHGNTSLLRRFAHFEVSPRIKLPHLGIRRRASMQIFLLIR